MSKTQNTLSSLLTTCSALLLSAQLSAMSGREVMELVEAQPTPTQTHAALKLEIVEENGQVKERLIELWSEEQDDLTRNVMVFRSPASVKDTRFLTIQNADRDDDQWIFLPALNKVRRISAGDKDGSFMGTEFSYSDMSSRDIDEHSYELLREEACGSYQCWVVESTPKNLDDSQYSKTITWIIQDQQMNTIKKAEFYDKSGELLKVLEVNEHRQLDGFWIANTTTMKNVQNGRASNMTNLQIELNKNVNDNLFSTRFLQTGRVN